MKTLRLIPLFIVFLLTACATQLSTDSKSSAKLTDILDARSDELKARYGARHPKETIEFFGIKPGMRVAEVLPGGGWYTQILAPYVGKEGGLYGLNYADDMWPMFGFFTPENIKARIASNFTFVDKVAGFAGEAIPSQGMAFDAIPEDLKGTMDVIFIVRALHNLNRFEDKAGTFSKALVDMNSLLKTGGVVGVVQHRAPETADDTWADGNKGYLKQSYVIKKFKDAGFELADSSEINANPKDKPTIEDHVWRLPPSLRGPKGTKEANAAIGESDRMTLKFIKK